MSETMHKIEDLLPAGLDEAMLLRHAPALWRDWGLVVVSLGQIEGGEPRAAVAGLGEALYGAREAISELRAGLMPTERTGRLSARLRGMCWRDGNQTARWPVFISREGRSVCAEGWSRDWARCRLFLTVCAVSRTAPMMSATRCGTIGRSIPSG